jgi:hypothetical protein
MEIEPTESPDTLFPATPETDVDDDIAAAEELPPFDDESLEDLVVEEPELSPVGKSWAFDFPSGQFFYASAQGPTTTWGAITLRYWIEKCLRTPRGALPIHDPGYGVEGLNQIIGHRSGEALADLEPSITSALLFHPRISEVIDFVADFDPAEEYVEVSFTVITDEEGFEEVSVSQLRLGGGLGQ